MMKTKGFVYVLILLVGLFTSCEHKDLYLLGDREMRVNVDWSLFDKEPVTGMTMYIYPDSSDVFKVETQNIDCAVLDLIADNYRFMVYNQSVSEFQTLEFVDMEDFERAYVRGATATSKWYSVKSEDEVISQYPQWFGTYCSDTIGVTPDMLEGYCVPFQGENKPEDYQMLLTTLTPENVVYTITVNVHNIRQIYNLSDVRGAISKMARGYYINKGVRGEEYATFLLEDWSVSHNPDDQSIGSLTASFTSFGLPSGHNCDPSDNILTLEILLVDLKTVIEIPVEVGDLFRVPEDVQDKELSLVVDVDLNYTLPDVPPADGGEGGFDATVDDWGEEVIHDIEF